ncbi:MAG: ABC transporter permease [Actinomycetota bacterium]
MRAALLIAAKDLRQRLRDRSAIMIAFVVPFGLGFVLNLTLAGVSGGSAIFRYAVVDQDRGEVARVFVDRVLGEAQRQGVLKVTEMTSVDGARDRVSKGKAAAAFVVPAGFTQAVYSEQASRIQVIGNVDEVIGTQVARSIAEGFASELAAVRVSVGTVVAGRSTAPPDVEALKALALKATSVTSPVSIRSVPTTEKELGWKTYTAAGMAVFFLFFTVQFGVSSLLDERREGTLARLLAAPIRRVSLLGGKLLTSFVLGVISMVVLALASTLFLGARWGNPLGVGILIVAGVLSAMGVMSVVATLAKTGEQAGNWQAIIGLVLGMLGGTFFPVAMAGGLLAKLSLITPHAWFLQGLSDMAGGEGPSAVVVPALALLAFAVATGSIALIRLKKLAQL